MKKQDLRVIKTKKNIKEEFRKLLKNKPIEKITVTELAENALINKGTFYLHYTDIYDLYEDVIKDFIKETFGTLPTYDLFFLDTRKFLNDFIHMFSFHHLEEEFPYFEPGTERLPIPFMITDTIKESLYQTQALERNAINDTKLEICIGAMTTPIIKRNQTDRDTYIDTMEKIIHMTLS